MCFTQHPSASSAALKHEAHTHSPRWSVESWRGAGRVRWPSGARRAAAFVSVRNFARYGGAQSCGRCDPATLYAWPAVCKPAVALAVARDTRQPASARCLRDDPRKAARPAAPCPASLVRATSASNAGKNIYLRIRSGSNPRPHSLVNRDSLTPAHPLQLSSLCYVWADRDVRGLREGQPSQLARCGRGGSGNEAQEAQLRSLME